VLEPLSHPTTGLAVRTVTFKSRAPGATLGRAMGQAVKDPLRILLANERVDHLEQMAHVTTRLGHAVIARETNIEAVAALTEEGIFDVAIVGVGEDTAHALDLIGRIVREANCPVIAVLDVEDPAFIHQAAKRGVFAYLAIHGAGDDQLESAIDVVLARFAEFHALEGAFGRRALTERAKGILMERHAVDESEAFLMLRDQSRQSNRKLIDIAQAILDAHGLLPGSAKDPMS
jgi:AmiR/NasT family two-component response regulator